MNAAKENEHLKKQVQTFANTDIYKAYDNERKQKEKTQKVLSQTCKMAVFAFADDGISSGLHAANLHQRHARKQPHAVCGIRRIHCGGMDLFSHKRRDFAAEKF